MLKYQPATMLLTTLLTVSGCTTSNIQAPRQAATATQPGKETALVAENPAGHIRARYSKTIHRIAMRDGVKLFTIVYAPKNALPRCPILMTRTPYDIDPSGKDEFPKNLGPNPLFVDENYIFVYQYVRGRGESEGIFENVRPYLTRKSKPTDIDENSDNVDTINYLLANIPNNNGRVGMWGISYPGFYCSAGMIDAHPALKAVSPQAPIGDWFFDDVRRHGAYVLPSAYNFLLMLHRTQPAPTTQPTPTAQTKKQKPAKIVPRPAEGYQFFLEMGSLKTIEEQYFGGKVEFWTQMTQHPNYDEFWQERNILPRLQHVAPAVLVVGGWYDAEDLYGTFSTYQAIEKQNPGITNTLAVGPWQHTGWETANGASLGNISFGSKTSEFYQKNIELPFFNRYLKDQACPALPEAYVFETGRNQWRTFDQWPPSEAKEKTLYIHADGYLSWRDIPNDELASLPPNNASNASYDEFISDPAKPVPFTDAIHHKMPSEYMTGDQRFASRRPDVLVYQTEPLAHDVTIAGPMSADLWVSTSAGDADWIVKVIDVYPPQAKDFPDVAMDRPLSCYQQLVRGEAIRGRFRESYAKPKPFVPNQPTQVRLPLQDVLHTFKAKHRIMVQIQSTWFPLIDRNPQKYVGNVIQANDSDFIKATHRVYHDAEHATHICIDVLE